MLSPVWIRLLKTGRGASGGDVPKVPIRNQTSPPQSVRVKYLAYLLHQCSQCEGFLEEECIGLQDSMTYNGIVSVAGHVQHSGLGMQCWHAVSQHFAAHLWRSEERR